MFEASHNKGKEKLGNFCSSLNLLSLKYGDNRHYNTSFIFKIRQET